MLLLNVGCIHYLLEGTLNRSIIQHLFWNKKESRDIRWQKSNEKRNVGAQLGPVNIIKPSPNWACQIDRRSLPLNIWVVK